MMNETKAGPLASQAEALLKSLKGVHDARVQIDAHGRLARICIMCPEADERQAARNVQSALFAVLGVTVEPGMLHFGVEAAPAPLPAQATANVVKFVTTPDAPPAVADETGAQVLEIGSARRADLNVAARVAFETLRAAQSSFHGFMFDGAELVRISGGQYIVVAVRRSTSEARYCGAAPVVDSVSTASARALMNAVGLAAMGTSAVEYTGSQLETRQA